MTERHRTGEQARRQLEASYTGYAGEDDELTTGRPGQMPAKVERPAGPDRSHPMIGEDVRGYQAMVAALYADSR